MALFLNNDDVKSLLTMELTMAALEKSYTKMIKGEAVCRPRIDLQIPTSDAQKVYKWGTMEGGSAAGYFAIRMKSDIAYEKEYEGTRTLEKYCVEPGTFCGLIFLFRVDNGEPLAIINDGYLQHMRVGADCGLGVKYIAREDAEVVGMFGSGGMARSNMASIRLVRNIRKIRVYSPTRANREAYAREMEEKYGIETTPLATPEEVYRGADILAGCTDANVPIILGRHIEKGTHVISVGGRPDAETFQRIDRFLRLGNATAPVDATEAPRDLLTYVTPSLGARKMKSAHPYVVGGVVKTVDAGKVVFLKDLLEGKKGRLSAEDITYSERGNLQGAQFHAIAGPVYELARERGVGREIPTEWFLQDIRD